jgi:hypothetical protein
MEIFFFFSNKPFFLRWARKSGRKREKISKEYELIETYVVDRNPSIDAFISAIHDRHGPGRRQLERPGCPEPARDLVQDFLTLSFAEESEPSGSLDGDGSTGALFERDTVEGGLEERTEGLGGIDRAAGVAR